MAPRSKGRRSNWGGKFAKLVPDDAVEGAVSKGPARARKRKVADVDEDEVRVVEVTSDVVLGKTWTKGGEVKSKGEVIATRIARGNQPHVNCRVENFGRLVSRFKSRKRRWVKEMGFYDLLWLVDKKLPRQLCYWLMTKLDPVKKRLVFSEDKIFPLNKNQVKWVLGIPAGPNRVPTSIATMTPSMKEQVAKFGKKYVVISKETRTKYLDREGMMKVLESEDIQEDQEDEFKEAFLAVVLTDVLCPTTAPRMSSELLPALTVASTSSSYDWCSYVLDKLFASCYSFASKFYATGLGIGCGGCTYFLALFYLDRIDRSPVRWGDRPRVKVWTMEEIGDAERADRFGVGGDFGKLGMVDAAYGESHPSEGRDVDPDAVKDLSSNVVIGPFHATAGLRRSAVRRKGPKDKSNPYARRLAKKSRVESVPDGSGRSGCDADDSDVVNAEAPTTAAPEKVDDIEPSVADDVKLPSNDGKVAVDNDLANVTFSQVSSQFGLYPSVDPIIPSQTESQDAFWVDSGIGPFGKIEIEDEMLNAAVNLAAPPELVSLSDDKSPYPWSKLANAKLPCDDCELPSSTAAGDRLHGDDTDARKPTLRRPRVTTDLKKTSRMKRARRRPRNAMDLAFVYCLRPRLSPIMKSRLVKFVMEYGAKIRQAELDGAPVYDPVMLSCENQFATLRNCFTVLEPSCFGVDDNYVRVAAALYSCRWKLKYGSGRIRVMLDPLIAIRVGQCLNVDTHSKDCQKWAKNFAAAHPGATPHHFAAVFVPVLERRHWWCVAFSPNSEQLWVMDSLIPDSARQHEKYINKLACAVDAMFLGLDDNWSVGRMVHWERISIHLGVQQDGDTCGVRMLLAIKACADHFQSILKVENILMDELNDKKLNVLKMISRNADCLGTPSSTRISKVAKGLRRNKMPSTTIKRTRPVTRLSVKMRTMSTSANVEELANEEAT